MVSNLIVTGTGGFIGKELVNYFSKSGQIRVWSAGRSSDLNSISKVAKANQLENVAVLLNGWSGVFSNKSNDFETQQLSLENFKRQVLECIDIGAALIIGFGSQAEYDGHGNSTSYAKAKKLARNFLLDQSEKNGVNAHWLRIFSVYGPGMDPRWILPKFIESAINNRVFEVGPCNQKWGFLHISDFCQAIDILVKKHADAPFDIDVGDPASDSLRETLLHAQYLMNWNHLTFGDSPSSTRDAVPDLRPLTALGWVPEVSFNQGFRDLVKHYAKSD